MRDHPAISKKTRKIVKDYAEAHKYKLNRLALQLRTNKNNTIGVIVPEIVHYFFSTVLDGIQQETESEGYNLLISDRKSTRLNSSHVRISYAVFCLKKKSNLLAIAGSSRGDHRRRAYEQPLPVHFHVGGEVRLVHEEELGTARLRRAPQRPVRRVNC